MLRSLVQAQRKAAGLTQAALAEAVGISRQSLSAIEAGKHTPSTAIALRLARKLSCDVEELFQLVASDLRAVLSASPPDGRVVLGKVHGRWIAHPAGTLPADGVVSMAATAGAETRVELLRPMGAETLLVAGCAPLLGLLASSVPGVRWLQANSTTALHWIQEGWVHVAGLHLAHQDDPRAHHRAAASLDEDCTLVNLAQWRQGLVVAQGNPKGIESPARSDITLVQREPGSGAQLVLERFVGEPREGVRAGSHAEVAKAVQWGLADAGVGIEASGLGFVPLTEERFDLLLPTRNENELEPLLSALSQTSFLREAELLGRYDLALAGETTRVPA